MTKILYQTRHVRIAQVSPGLLALSVRGNMEYMTRDEWEQLKRAVDGPEQLELATHAGSRTTIS